MYKLKTKLFFTYYGGKYRIAQKYPKPLYDRVIEPFAGSAGYSLTYPDKEIILYDLNPRICGVWDFLINAKENEVLDLPENFEDIRELKIPQEAAWLIGFWCNKGSSEPRNKPSTWMKSQIRPNSYWGSAIKKRIASQLKHIRHWKIYNESYVNVENKKSTWFVDPPYSGKAGRLYTFNEINYESLGEWCKSRIGQTIVCENYGANWLPFEMFYNSKSLEGLKGKKKSIEALWTNATWSEKK